LSLICHRIPERTFKIGKYYFPVCSRCTGIYTGSSAYYTIAYLIPIKYNVELIMIGLFLITPMLLDGTTQLMGIRKSNNKLRFITGLIAGIGIGILVKSIKYCL